MADPTPLDPWDRQPGEPETAYGYFVHYRDLGRTRTVAQVADRVNRSRNYVHNLAAARGWVRRAQAWDREQDRLYSERLVVRRLEMADRHARLAVAVQNLLVQRLQNIRPEQLTAGDVARWLEVATRLERLALGMPETTTGVTGGDGGPIEMEVTGMSDSEREAFFRALVAEAAARAGMEPGRDEQ